jgi:hypothetical protein
LIPPTKDSSVSRLPVPTFRKPKKEYFKSQVGRLLGNALKMLTKIQNNQIQQVGKHIENSLEIFSKNSVCHPTIQNLSSKIGGLHIESLQQLVT